MSEWNCLVCKEFEKGIACTFCDDGSKFVRMTNAERIRNMTDEELAEFLAELNACEKCKYDSSMGCLFENPCTKSFAEAMALEWLKAEVEEGE